MHRVANQLNRAALQQRKLNEKLAEGNKTAESFSRSIKLWRRNFNVAVSVARKSIDRFMKISQSSQVMEINLKLALVNISAVNKMNARKDDTKGCGSTALCSNSVTSQVIPKMMAITYSSSESIKASNAMGGSAMEMSYTNTTQDLSLQAASKMGNTMQEESMQRSQAGWNMSGQNEEVIQLGLEAQRSTEMFTQLNNEVQSTVEAVSRFSFEDIMQLWSAFESIKEAVSGGVFSALLELFNYLMANVPAFEDLVMALLESLIPILFEIFDIGEWLAENWFEIISFMIGLFDNLGNILLGLLPIISAVIAAWQSYQLIVNLVSISTRIYMSIMQLFNTIKMVFTNITKAATLAMRAFNTAIRTNPIAFIISLIIGLITALLSFQVITGGIKKVFSDAFGFIMDVAEGAVNFVISIINTAIRAINKVSGFFANLLGIEAKEIEELEIQADFSKAKKAGQDFIENFSMEDLKNQIGLEQIVTSLINLLWKTKLIWIWPCIQAGMIRFLILIR